MDPILELARRYELVVIEDAAEGLGARYKEQVVGAIGDIACLSFNGNKIITTGGGGMILTNNKTIARKAKHITTQAKAHPLEYFHDETGYNYRLVNILAAIGVAQMEQLPDFIKRKKEIDQFYRKELSTIKKISFQEIPSPVNSNHWLFTILVPNSKPVIQLLEKSGIQARSLWVPMNQLPMYKKAPYVTTVNISEKIYSQSISLPCSTNITNNELKEVAAYIKKIIN